ncbi:hypothetical protein CFAM422_004024 [Trichoderma lentiforme]|uniref:Uncharacterized protein n=1 Tax=Trichoderma lentiforme TaxID=1567552 RepID=A0A9P4XJ22_9HYPO|nr:hypothetical protein CFAM422_004024 [Trichoderma lentiforme]
MAQGKARRGKGMRPLVRCLSFGERRALVLFVLRRGANSSRAEPGWANGRCEGRCIYGYASDQRERSMTNERREDAAADREAEA